jgi:polynucleotide 5'-kinase involved in rRNA processing
MRFAAYFRDAETAQFAFTNVAFCGSWLGSGTPVASHLLKFVNETLAPNVRVYYAELSGRRLGLMVNRPVPDGPEMAVVMGQLKAKEVSVTVAPALKHLLVGMEAGNGKMLGLGLIESLDFRRGTIGLLTPVRSPETARILRLGTQRIAPDGRDAGQISAIS